MFQLLFEWTNIQDFTYSKLMNLNFLGCFQSRCKLDVHTVESVQVDKLVAKVPRLSTYCVQYFYTFSCLKDQP